MAARPNYSVQRYTDGELSKPVQVPAYTMYSAAGMYAALYFPDSEGMCMVTEPSTATRVGGRKLFRVYFDEHEQIVEEINESQ